MTLLLSLVLACTDPPGDSGGEGVFVAGDYQFYTVTADDGCLDGAMEALFMPEGPETPHPFEDLIYVPALEELPLTYEVSFREPFVGMEVTAVDDGDGAIAFEESLMEAVLLNEALYGDCAADMTVSGRMQAKASGEAGTGAATVDLSNATGSEGRCPPLDADPCRVELSLTLELSSPSR